MAPKYKLAARYSTVLGAVIAPKIQKTIPVPMVRKVAAK
jgi:hypothetical protein